MRANGIYSSAADVGKTMTAMNLTRDCCEHSVSAQVSRSIIYTERKRCTLRNRMLDPYRGELLVQHLTSELLTIRSHDCAQD